MSAERFPGTTQPTPTDPSGPVQPNVYPPGAALIGFEAADALLAQAARERALVERVADFNAASQEAIDSKKAEFDARNTPVGTGVTPSRGVLVPSEGEHGFVKGTPIRVYKGRVVAGWQVEVPEDTTPSATEWVREHLPAEAAVAGGGLIQMWRRRRLGSVVTSAETLAEDVDVAAATVRGVRYGQKIPGHLRPVTRKQVRVARWAVEEKEEILAAETVKDQATTIVGNWDGPDARSEWSVLRDTDGDPVIDATGRPIPVNDVGTPAQEARLRDGRYRAAEVKLERAAADMHAGAAKTVHHSTHALEDVQRGIDGDSKKSQAARAKVAKAQKIAGKLQRPTGAPSGSRLSRLRQARQQPPAGQQGHRLNP